ncbi:hypothetical protein SCE1572_26255 [Sorangium cellulosum So0157-2]|uniref:Uncharacterized protein n=1 Tax=Sorangium cellulosum So0157-2 TaxID=1254432 RepID=S4XZB0_SORCE|nr:hypothetical protein SCE1572_26255 [Sorangium cellulosum So0157-2]
MHGYWVRIMATAASMDFVAHLTSKFAHASRNPPGRASADSAAASASTRDASSHQA